jgi:hypothetical protein
MQVHSQVPAAQSLPSSPVLQQGLRNDERARLRSSGSLTDDLQSLRSTLPVQAPISDDLFHDSAPLGVQTPGTTMSALTETLSATTASHNYPSSTPADTPVVDSLEPESQRASAHSTPLCESTPPPEDRQPPGQPKQQQPLDVMVLPLAQLARAHSWHTVREADGVEYAELRSLPPSLSTPDDGGLGVALRVSTAMTCSLDTLEEVVRSPGHSPEIDPELVCLVAAPSSSQICSQLDAHAHQQRHPIGNSSSTGIRGAETTSENAPDLGVSQRVTDSPRGHLSASVLCQLRHLQLNAEWPFTHAWDVLLRCTEGELNPYEGGQLGFHTPGIPASTYIWVGSSDDDSSHASSAYRHGFQRMHLRVFGLVAVAIPRSASVVRVTHYLLFQHPSSQSLRAVRQADSRFAVKGKERAASDFLQAVSCWMGRRVCRLRCLCEAQQLERARNSMVPLDKKPLLQYLYTEHCAQQQTSTARGAPHRIGDVVVRRAEAMHDDSQSASSAASSHLSANANSTRPPLYVFSLVFPCTLRHLRAYMNSTSARTRYTLDEHVVFYEELPGPPGLRVIHLEGSGYTVSTASPQTSFMFLEAFGALRGKGVPHPTLVLSRANCDWLQPNAEAEGVEGEGILSHRGGVMSDCDAVHVGRIYCSGWVATAMDHTDDDVGVSDGDSLEMASSNASLNPVHYSSNIVH